MLFRSKVVNQFDCVHVSVQECADSNALFPAGSGASVPEGLQREGVVWGRGRLLPVQRVRLVP